jgi:hypothetical protein
MLHFLPEIGVFSTGCFYGDGDRLLEMSAEQHGTDSAHYRSYSAAIAGLIALAQAMGIAIVGAFAKGETEYARTNN